MVPPGKITASSKGESSTKSRRAYLRAVGTTALLGTAGCLGGGGSGKPDFIRYLGWGGNTQNSVKQLFKKWSDETGIEVKHQSAGGDSEFISILKQNPGSIDIVNFSSYGISVARQEDLLAKIKYDQLPNYKENMQKEFRNAPYVQDDTVFRDPLTQGFTYNTDKVDQELTSWKDLASSEFGEQISLRDDALSRFSNAALATGSNVNKIVEEDSAYQKAVDHQKQLNPQVKKYWGSGAQAIQLLREENVMVSEMWGGRTLALEEDGYDQMQYVIPEEGTYVLDENYNIPKKSEKQEWVHDLINWSFKRDNAIELSKNLGYPIMINDPPEDITSLPDYVDSINQLSWPDWGTVNPQLSQMQRDFQKIKQG